MVPNAEEQRKLREYDDPTYGYRLEGEEIVKDVFDGDLPAGWHDSPAKCRKGRAAAPPAPAATGPEPAKKPRKNRKAAADEPPPEPLEPPYHGYSARLLSREIKRRNGKGPLPGTTKPEMVEALIASDAEEANAAA